MKFLVVIATIRENLPGFPETMDRIRGTFAPDTEFHILDGHAGKAQALNKAGKDILRNTVADCYVTMDDDIVPGVRWPSLVETAFQNLPQYGAFGLWMGDDPVLRAAQGEENLDADQQVAEITYRRVRPPHHINGGFIAYRTDVARQIGDIPTEGVRYQLWEDAWRGRRVTKLGWEMAFLKGAEVDLVEYPDPEEYLARKQEELMIGKETSDRVLAESGLGDPIGIRLRKFLARMRGRG